MTANDFRQRLAAGQRLLMINPDHVSSGLAARLPQLGADLIFVDCEHGTASFEDVRNMALAAWSTGGGAIVRPPTHCRADLVRYLHCGVEGVMLPSVDTVEQAARIAAIVAEAKAPGDGAGPLVICIIESVEAVGNLDGIVDVPGIDVLFVGPTDLGKSIAAHNAVPGNEPLDVVETVNRALGRIRRSARWAGTMVTLDNVEARCRAGAQFLYAKSEPLLKRGLQDLRERAVS